MNDANFTGKVALVTGASRGIGAAIARAFAKAGASIAIAARDGVALERFADELKELGGLAVAIPADVSDARAVERLVEETIARFGRLDIACNNAGRSGPAPAPLAEIGVDDFDAAMAVNLRGVFLGLKYEIPAMLAGGGGTIVNTSSTAGLQA